MGFSYQLARLIFDKITDEYYADRVDDIDTLRGRLADQHAFTPKVESLLNELEEQYEKDPDGLLEEIERIKDTHPALIRELKKRR
jgi:hypothetical protein